MAENLLDPKNDSMSEAGLFSFIVRVWREETTIKKRRIVLRGHITPILGGERHYFSDIKDIPAFIAAFLKTRS